MSIKRIINIVNLGALIFFGGILAANAEEKGTFQKFTEMFSGANDAKKSSPEQGQQNSYARHRDKFLETLSADVKKEVLNYHKKKEKLKADLSADAKAAVDKLEMIQAREKMRHHRNLAKRQKKLEEVQAAEKKADAQSKAPKP